MKRILCLLLALLMVFTLVACGSSEDTDKEDGGKKPNSSDQSNADSDKDTADKEDGDKNEPDSKLEGTLVGGTNGYPQIAVQNNTVKVLSNAKIADRLKEELKAVYGLDVVDETVHYNDYTTKFATQVLSGESPDIGFYRRDQSDFPRYIVNDLVDDVNQYVDLSDPFYDPVRDLLEGTTYQGGNYMLPYGLGTGQAVFYNAKLFEDYGMETPWELYLKDEWTLDKLQEYAIELTEVGLDGVPTRYGFSFVRPFGIFYTMGKSLGSFDAKTGAVINNNKDPDFATAMKYLSDWITKYKCTPNDCEQTVNWLTTGKTAMAFCETWWGNEAFVSLAADGNLGIAPMARGENCDGYYARGEVRSWWLVKGAQNPGGAIALWNVCIKDFDEDGHLQAIYDTCKESGYSELNMEQVRTCLDQDTVKPVLELTPWLTGGADWWTILKSSTWEVELGKVESNIQATIDSLFKPLEEDLPISPKPVDDFENHGDGTEHIAAYAVAGDGGKDITVTLNKDNAQGGSKYAAQYQYDVSDVGWGGVTMQVGKTWKNNNALRFWVKGDGTKQTIKWQVTCINGASFTYSYELTGDEGKIVSIPFADFTPADPYTADDWMLDKVNNIGLFVETEGAHTFWIDNIEVFDTEK